MISHCIVVLICFSLIISDVEHLFMWLLAICVCLFGKMSIHLLCPSFNWVVWFLGCCWILRGLYIFWILYPLSDILFTNIFFHSMSLFYWWFPLLCRSFLVWCNPVCLFLLLFPLPEETSRKILLRPMSKSILRMFSSRNLMVSGFTFKSLIHSELIFVMVWDSSLVSFFFCLFF